MRRYVHLVFWPLLYGAFVLAACILKGHLAGQAATEFCGWDYQTFVDQIQDWRWIGHFGFRHPGLGIVCSPLVALEHVWSGAYLLVMPLVATVTAWLIWKMSRWVGLIVWLAMPMTWCMAGIPESFPFAQLALVASVWRGATVVTERPRGTRSPTEGAFPECAARVGARALPRGMLIAVAFAVLNTMITLTNGVKPLLGWLALNWKELDRKMIVRGAIGLAAMAVLGVGFFYVRTLITGRGMGAGIEATLSWIPAERNIPQELYGFFIGPVGLVQSFIVYPLALLGLYKMMRTFRRTPAPKTYSSLPLLLSSYFVVDLLIHCVIGWGMSEPWLFAPHWVWMLPIFAGQCGILREEQA